MIKFISKYVLVSLAIILKKLVAIVFLFVFLFNVGGYYIIYLGWHAKAEVEMAARIDDERYSEEETVTIAIPFNLPYQSEESTFKRVHGDFQHNGEFYKLVKQKIQNDTLFIVCIKDHEEKQASKFMADMVKTSSDAPASSSTMKLLNNLIKDYMKITTIFISSENLSAGDPVFTSEQGFNTILKYYPVASPPPESFS